MLEVIPGLHMLEYIYDIKQLNLVLRWHSSFVVPDVTKYFLFE